MQRGRHRRFGLKKRRARQDPTNPSNPPPPPPDRVFVTTEYLGTKHDKETKGVKTVAKVGRPSLFTEEVRTKILTALRGGNYRSVAAQYAGVSHSTLRNWLLLAKDPHAPPEYVEFLQDVEKAEADAEVADIALIRRSAQDGNWNAAAWVRERKNPERWGRKDRSQVEISGPDGSAVEVNVAVGADAAAIASLAAVLAGRLAERSDPLRPVLDTSGGEVDVAELDEGSVEDFRIAPGELLASSPSLAKKNPPKGVSGDSRGQSGDSGSEGVGGGAGSGHQELDEYRERQGEQEAFEAMVEELEADPEWDWLSAEDQWVLDGDDDDDDEDPDWG